MLLSVVVLGRTFIALLPTLVCAMTLPRYQSSGSPVLFQDEPHGMPQRLPGPLSPAYRKVLQVLNKFAVFLAQGTFSRIYYMLLDNRRVVLKVPRFDPSQRMFICVKPTSSEDVLAPLRHGQYLYVSMAEYLKRERNLLYAASRCLPPLFRLVNTQVAPRKVPFLDEMTTETPYIVTQSAVMTLRDLWMLHMKGVCTLTNSHLVTLAMQLLLQLALLHKHGITHGDLRLDNFLLFRSPNTIPDARFQLSTTHHYNGIVSQYVVSVPFRAGYFGLVKLGDYGNAHYVDKLDKATHKQHYETLERVLFQDLDTATYLTARKHFWRCRNRILANTDLTYPKLVSS